MDNISSLTKRWKSSRLPAVFYHTTFVENVPVILREQRLVANKGESMCKEKNGLVSLSDRITKGIVEFFGNVVFEFDAVSIFRRNKSVSPRSYGSSSNIRKYDEMPLFENEWVVPEQLNFSLADIKRVLLITNRNSTELEFEKAAKALKSKGVECICLSERWLPDNTVTDMTSYLLRIRGWNKFNKVARYA